MTTAAAAALPFSQSYAFPSHSHLQQTFSPGVVFPLYPSPLPPLATPLSAASAFHPLPSATALSQSTSPVAVTAATAGADASTSASANIASSTSASASDSSAVADSALAHISPLSSPSAFSPVTAEMQLKRPTVASTLSRAGGKKAGTAGVCAARVTEKLRKRLARKAELARASRRRKKVYIDGLEDRVQGLLRLVEELKRCNREGRKYVEKQDDAELVAGAAAAAASRSSRERDGKGSDDEGDDDDDDDQRLSEEDVEMEGSETAVVTTAAEQSAGFRSRSSSLSSHTSVSSLSNPSSTSASSSAINSPASAAAAALSLPISATFHHETQQFRLLLPPSFSTLLSMLRLAFPSLPSSSSSLSISYRPSRSSSSVLISGSRQLRRAFTERGCSKRGLTVKVRLDRAAHHDKSSRRKRKHRHGVSGSKSRQGGRGNSSSSSSSSSDDDSELSHSELSSHSDCELHRNSKRSKLTSPLGIAASSVTPVPTAVAPITAKPEQQQQQQQQAASLTAPSVTICVERVDCVASSQVLSRALVSLPLSCTFRAVRDHFASLQLPSPSDSFVWLLAGRLLNDEEEDAELLRLGVNDGALVQLVRRSMLRLTTEQQQLQPLTLEPQLKGGREEEEAAQAISSLASGLLSSESCKREVQQAA